MTWATVVLAALKTAWKWVAAHKRAAVEVALVVVACYAGWRVRGAWDAPKLGAAAATVRTAEAEVAVWKGASGASNTALVEAAKQWAKISESLKLDAKEQRDAFARNVAQAQAQAEVERARNRALMATLPRACSDKVIEMWSRSEVNR